MENKCFRWLQCAPLLLAVLLSACGGVKLWPFGAEQVRERSRSPANASEYQCSGGKRFYLRRLDNDAAVWAILPDREVRLDKTATDKRYSNGISVLSLDGNGATLEDGASTFSGCTRIEK